MPFDWLKLYAFVAHGLPIQQPFAVCEFMVLNASLFPEGTQPATHFPLLQYGVLPPHAKPHAPQLLTSNFRSVQMPLHVSDPFGQHTLPVQISFMPHAFVHAPQL